MTNNFFIVRGDDAKGNIDLSGAKSSNNTVTIPGSPTSIVINFPGASSTVTVSGTGVTGVTGNTVTVTDYANGLMYFLMDSTKSAGLALGQAQNMDILITASGKTYAYEFTGVLDVADPVTGS